VNDRATTRRRKRTAGTGATPPAGFALFDAGFRLVDWNASFAALRGYPRRLIKAGTPLEAFVRFDAGRGEYGAGTAEPLARRRLAALRRTARTDRELALPDGRRLRIGSERLAAGGLLLTCEDVTAQLARERQLAEHTAAQTAVLEVLEAISRSAFDLEEVLRRLIESATRLCGAEKGFIWRLDGDVYRLVVDYGGVSAEFREFELAHPVRPGRDSLIGRTALEGCAVHIEDAAVGSQYGWREVQRLGRFRTLLGVPIIRDGTVIGVLALWKERVEPFTPAQIQLVTTFSSQAAIAIENARLFNETKEALEAQTATAEILKVISSSPTDVQPVFDAIVQSGVRLFQGVAVALRLVQGDRIERAAFATGPGCRVTDDGFTQRALALDDRSFAGRAIERAHVVHAPDILAEEWASEAVRANAERGGWRACAAAPMLREGRAIGAIIVMRDKAAPYGENEIALLRTFADQAVIAIENARLFNELEARNRELTGALDREKATAEILRAISSSPTDIQPVLDAVAERAGKLCDAPHANVMLVEGDQLRVMSVYSTEPGPRPDQRNFLPIARTYLNGRAVLDREVVHIPDVVPLIETEFPDIRRNREKFGFRAVLVVPLMREGRAIGTVFVWRREPGLFSSDQVALLRTFADQAVIAIENVRLFNETKEALDHQKASAEVLQVISSSVANTEPVFQKILQSCQRLFEGRNVGIGLVEDDGAIHLTAYHGPGRDELERHYPLPLDDSSGAGVAILRRRVVHYPDLEAAEIPSHARRGAQLAGFQSMLIAPMLWEGRGVGVIFVGRAAVGEFSAKEIGLLETFAHQAVIAIQNARLFNETKEALEKQTAISEILRVISSSPSDVQPVFDTIVRSAVTLCGSTDGAVFRYDGERLHYAAGFNLTPEWLEAVRSRYPMRPEESTIAGRAILQLSLVQIDDVLADPTYDHERAIRGGWRRMLAVPMLRESAPLGVIVVSWPQPGPTPKSQEDLLRTFADQAVIAIENVRLFNETKEALDQLKASAEVLQVISSSVADTKPVFEKILESCERLFASRRVGLNLIGPDGLVHAGAYSDSPGAEKLRKENFPHLLAGSATGAAITAGRVVHYPDVFGDPDVPPYARRGAEKAGFRSFIMAPLLSERRGLGAIFVGRETVGAFSEKEIALLKTFADQAVIAIQNAKLFREIQEKSHQLEVANQHKSAFLANMSHELRTPLNAVIGFSEMLNARYFGELTAKQAEYVNDIHGSGKHLLSLINDILDLSKIEAGRMELETASFDLRAALDNALTLVRERAQRGGVALRLESDPTLGAIDGDERKLKQAVLNLLSNAVKFTPRGGAVSVIAKRANGAAEIAVTDTGVGIAPADQAAIFEAFRQVGTDATRKREGTGLGLALARRFVELHGGTIRVESAPGKGSTFTVTFPLRHGE
jgi:GAF domain-containing protein/anti-sigma regulatory factor (Ser/Thr protein kinase)